MNKLPNTETKMKLKGILIGNGCTNPRECYQPDSVDSMSIYQYEFLYNHNFITDKDYSYITGACILGYYSAGCKDIRNKVDKQFSATKTVINNIYQPCYNQKISSPQKYVLQGRKMRNMVGEF